MTLDDALNAPALDANVYRTMVSVLLEQRCADLQRTTALQARYDDVREELRRYHRAQLLDALRNGPGASRIDDEEPEGL
jgi:hypothetical protein